MSDIPLKRCSKCGEEKPATTEFFHRQSARKDGLHTDCKVCRNKPPKVSDVPEGYKRCTKCGEEKPSTLEFFYQQELGKDGLTARCKECIRIYDKTRHATTYDPDRARVRHKAWRTKHPDYNRIRSKTWRTEHPDRARASKKASYAKHRDTRLAHHKVWRTEHPDRVKANSKADYAKNHERYIANNHARRAREKGLPGHWTPQDIQDMLKRQKGKCNLCKEKLAKYHIDHIIPVTRPGSTNWPDNLQLLCRTCNLKKQNKLPHEFFERGRLF